MTDPTEKDRETAQAAEAPKPTPEELARGQEIYSRLKYAVNPGVTIAFALASARSEASGGWVPVRDRQPEGPSRRVLAWAPGEAVQQSWWHWYGPIEIGPGNVTATHWREMPDEPALPGAPHE